MRFWKKCSLLAAALMSAGLLISLERTGANGPAPSPGDSLAADSTAQAPVDSAVQAVAGSTAEATTGQATQAPADSAAQTVADSTAKAPADSAVQAVADSTAKAPADSTAETEEKPPPIPLDQLRIADNSAFGVGERLEFEISYGPINAGSAVMEVKEIVPVEGRECYRVISTAQSNRFFSAIYRVEDRVESLIDTRGLFPWKFKQKLQEGKHRADRWADYDQVNHSVTTNRGTLDVPPYVQDVLSILYYARTLEMAVGDTFYIDNHSGRKVYPLAVKVQGRERVKVPAGTFDCLVVEPMLKAGGLFKHEGRIWVWLTDNTTKLPVLMKTKVIIGTVDAKLKTYRLGKIL